MKDNKEHYNMYFPLMNQMADKLKQINPNNNIKCMATGIENLNLPASFDTTLDDPNTMALRALADFTIWINDNPVVFDLKEPKYFNSSTGNLSIIYFEAMFQSSEKDPYLIFSKDGQWMCVSFKIESAEILVPSTCKLEVDQVCKLRNSYAERLGIYRKKFTCTECNETSGSDKPYVLVPTHNAIPLDELLTTLSERYEVGGLIGLCA